MDIRSSTLFTDFDLFNPQLPAEYLNHNYKRPSSEDIHNCEITKTLDSNYRVSDRLSREFSALSRQLSDIVTATRHVRLNMNSMNREEEVLCLILPNFSAVS